MAKATRNGGDASDAAVPAEPPTCGIVMPISPIDDCTAAHWADVLEVVKEAAEAAGFAARLVSSADYSGIILGEIVGNLYSDPIVVCDVSARNPNVMFELGMRLAFDKPTIIIKDDKTDYAFDTSPIEHLGYPRDLRYQTIVRFKQSLADKIKATHERAAQSDYKSFLKHFGTFKIATVDVKEVSGQEFILEEMREIRTLLLRSMRVRDRTNISKNVLRPQVLIEALHGGVVIGGLTQDAADEFMEHLDIDGVENAYYDNSTNQLVIAMKTTGDANFAKLVDVITTIARNVNSSSVVRLVNRS